MKVYYLELEISFHTTAPDDTPFDEFTTRVMDALCDLEEVDQGIIDPDIGANLATRVLDVQMGVQADSARDAARLFLANVRAALHAAGCGTPGWLAPPHLEEPRKVEFADA